MNNHSEPRGPKRFVRWVMLGSFVLACVIAAISPTKDTLGFLGGALLLMLLVLSVRSMQAKAQYFSLRVHPGIVVLVVTVWLSLIVSELLLRIILFQQFPDFERLRSGRLGYQYDATLGWFPAPNSHEESGYLQQTISFDHNSRGFRDPEPSHDSRPAVVFLGDSFTWGYCVDATNRFTDRLRKRHPEWQVYNFGVVGYGNDQEYLLLQRHFQEYKPRVVFLTFCSENDHTDNGSNGDSIWAFKPYFRLGPKGLELKGIPVPSSDWVFYLRHPLLSKSYLLRLTMRAWGNIRSPRPRQGNDPTNAILEALQKYVTSRNAVFCVGITARDPNLEKFLQQSNIPWLDLSTTLRLEADWHWSSEGNAYVADRIEQFLTAEKLLQRR